ncbi:hypothetical protein NMD1_01237 [Novosphingobium sp. MD-1]|nr:hypothetical protein NMD1_01237 [Novosphingobium sp. MD-1]
MLAPADAGVDAPRRSTGESVDKGRRRARKRGWHHDPRGGTPGQGARGPGNSFPRLGWRLSGKPAPAVSDG